MELLTSADVWIAFATPLVLEIVLGVDNVVFISILAGRLPAHQQSRARIVGLALALITRILLLLSLSWVIGLTAPLFSRGLPRGGDRVRRRSRCTGPQGGQWAPVTY